MARFGNAIWKPGQFAESYVGGPWRIVWHTTEGSSALDAFALFQKHFSWPHFTVDEDHVYQHYDTSVASRSLVHPPGVETNHWHAVQIELVAYAAQAKTPALLARAAHLARWIEKVHGVVQAWPNGYPLPPKNGGDPGGHNRDATTWTKQGGHYGHCHVPGNAHWDPGLIDVHALMAPDPIIGDFPDPPAGVRYA